MKKFFLGSILFCSSYIFINNKNIKLRHSYSVLKCDMQPKKAICILQPHNSNARGVVMFQQDQFDGPTMIKGKFSGLKNNSKHGFHIHEWGDMTDGCTTAGPHFNPTSQKHGGPDDDNRHVGDLGNVESDENGEAIYERKDNKITLMGINSIIGRSCVVHEDEDDLGRGNFPDSLTTGHSGKRIACGIIALCDRNKSM